MAAAKMNTMHWHITDGNSVPIESKLFPELSKKGAYNPVTMVYTQDQVKTVVDYARHRGIRVRDPHPFFRDLPISQEQCCWDRVNVRILTIPQQYPLVSSVTALHLMLIYIFADLCGIMLML